MKKTPAQIAAQLAQNHYSWPGGYPGYAITDDGGALCHRCCESELETIGASYPGDGWHVIGADVNWEDTTLVCDHCGERIERAY